MKLISRFLDLGLWDRQGGDSWHDRPNAPRQRVKHGLLTHRPSLPNHLVFRWSSPPIAPTPCLAFKAPHSLAPAYLSSLISTNVLIYTKLPLAPKWPNYWFPNMAYNSIPSCFCLKQWYSKCGPGPAASASPGNGLDMQILSSYIRLAGRECQGWEPSNLCPSKPSRWF